MTQINVNTPGVKNGVSNQILMERVETLGHKHVVYDSKEASLKDVSFKDMIEALIESCEGQEYKSLFVEENVGGAKTIILQLDNDMIIDLTCWGASFGLDIFSNDPDTAKSYLKDYMPKYAPAEVDSEDQVQINFWTFNGKQGISYERDLQTDSLEEVEGNYSEEVYKKIDALANNYEDRNGKLVILSGSPGTGKTTIIRSLLREWGDKVRPDYVIDPENFFVGAPSYMIDVLLKDTKLSSLEAWEYDLMEEKVEEGFKKKVIIIEDCGSLIKDTAKEETGQGLSRLLNMVDGMIGQGLDILVILTTNENIHTFHEAVTREGRIHTMIEFTKLTEDESVEWLKNKEIEITDKITKKIEHGDGLSLAECYDLLNNEEEKSVKIQSSNEKKTSVGFA